MKTPESTSVALVSRLPEYRNDAMASTMLGLMQQGFTDGQIIAAYSTGWQPRAREKCAGLRHALAKANRTCCPTA